MTNTTNTYASARNDWDILEDIYAALMAVQGLDDEEPVNPEEITEYDLDDAIAGTEYDILGGEYFPTIRIIQALGRAGYLDDDRIWDELTEAAARGITRMAEERWEESREDEDGEDW